MPFLHSYTQKSIISREIFRLGHSLLLFPNLHSISLITKNKINLENDRILEWHKKRLRLIKPHKLIKPQK